MNRDELLRHLVTYPPETEIGVQLGDQNLDISDVTAWGGGAFVALECLEVDLRDLLTEWHIPVDRHDELVRKAA
jgi:hypothetical protein